MSDRKKDHIELAFKSQTGEEKIDNRFHFEPLINPHLQEFPKKFTFLGKELKAPLWISSMTGGTALAKKINENLAIAAHEFGLGMGLGSCRALLENESLIADFDVRHIIGNELPFFANLGIAQLEESIEKNEVDKVQNLIDRLQADGLIIHINPLQEFFQPEGNRFKYPPIDTIIEFKKLSNLKIIVKEVGQGFGYESLKLLMKSNVDAIDFAAFGGTNFALLEILRAANSPAELLSPLAYVGNTNEEMVNNFNIISKELENEKQFPPKDVIISGGINNFLDGYYFINKINANAIYGQASKFLAFGKDNIDDLRDFVKFQIEGLKTAYAFLRIK